MKITSMSDMNAEPESATIWAAARDEQTKLFFVVAAR